VRSFFIAVNAFAFASVSKCLWMVLWRYNTLALVAIVGWLGYNTMTVIMAHGAKNFTIPSTI